METLIERAMVTANQVSNYELRGSVTDMTGLIIEGTGPKRDYSRASGGLSE